MTSEKTRRAVFFVRAVVTAIIILIGLLTFTAITAVKSIETRDQVNETQRFDPCVSLSEAVAHDADQRQLAELTVNCKMFLDGLAPLVTVKLACAFIHRGGYVCPAPRAASNAQPEGGGQPVLGPTFKPMAATQGGSGDTRESSPHPKQPPGTDQAPKSHHPSVPDQSLAPEEPGQPPQGGAGGGGDEAPGGEGGQSSGPEEPDQPPAQDTSVSVCIDNPLLPTCLGVGLGGRTGG